MHVCNTVIATAMKYSGSGKPSIYIADSLRDQTVIFVSPGTIDTWVFLNITVVLLNSSSGLVVHSQLTRDWEKMCLGLFP